MTTQRNFEIGHFIFDQYRTNPPFAPRVDRQWAQFVNPSMQNNITDTEVEVLPRLPALSIVTNAAETDSCEVNGLARLQSFPGLCSPLHSAKWRLAQVSMKSKRDVALADNLGLEDEAGTSPIERFPSDEGSPSVLHREQMDRRNELSLRSPTDAISRQNSSSLVKVSILGQIRVEPSLAYSSGEP